LIVVSSVVLATVVGAVLRISPESSQSYWYDEAVTVWLLREPFVDLLKGIAQTENTPPLYYVAAWAWTRLFGDGEFALRSLSGMAGIATIPVTFLAGRALVSKRAGVVAAWLVAVSPVLVWYSQEARAYAFLVFLCTTSVWLFAEARAGRGVWLAAWAVVSAIALTAHYYAMFLVAAEALWLIAESRGRRRMVWAAVAVPAVIGAALLPLASHQEDRGRGQWIAGISLHRRLEAGAEQLLGGENTVQLAWLVWIAAFAVAVGVILFYGTPRARRGAGTAAVLAASAVLVPLAVAAVAQLRPNPYLPDTWLARNVIASLPLVAIVLGAALTVRRLGVAGPIAAAAVVLFAVTVEIDHRNDNRKTDWRGLAAALKSNPAKGVVVSPGHEQTVLRLYHEGLRGVGLDGANVKTLTVAIHAGDEDDVLCEPGDPGERCFFPPAGARTSSTMTRDFQIERFEWAQPVSVAGGIRTTNIFGAGLGPALFLTATG